MACKLARPLAWALTNMLNESVTGRLFDLSLLVGLVRRAQRLCQRGLLRWYARLLSSSTRYESEKRNDEQERLRVVSYCRSFSKLSCPATELNARCKLSFVNVSSAKLVNALLLTNGSNLPGRSDLCVAGVRTATDSTTIAAPAEGASPTREEGRRIGRGRGRSVDFAARRRCRRRRRPTTGHLQANGQQYAPIGLLGCEWLVGGTPGTRVGLQLTPFRKRSPAGLRVLCHSALPAHLCYCERSLRSASACGHGTDLHLVPAQSLGLPGSKSSAVLACVNGKPTAGTSFL